MANPYFDVEKRVFFNKVGIENQEELEEWEYQQTAIKSNEILENPQLIKTQSFNLNRQKEIHAHLFGDIYEWAGQIRTLPQRKLNAQKEMCIFAEADQIEQHWREIEQKTKSFF